MSFHLSRHFSLPTCAWTTFQSGFHALFDKALSHSFYRSEAEVEGAFDVRVTPTALWLMAICFQQDPSMIDLGGSMFPSRRELLQVLPLVSR